MIDLQKQFNGFEWLHLTGCFLASLLCSFFEKSVCVLHHFVMTHKRAKQDEHPIIIDETDTAELIGVSPTTLRTWRCRGGGPPFYRLGGGRRGRIRYERTEVLAWLRAGRVDQPGRG